MTEPEANTLKVSSLGECIETCLSNSTCRAFNTKKAGNAVDCEHLTRDRNTHPGDIVVASGWNYYDTGLYKTQVRVNVVPLIQHCILRDISQNIFLVVNHS